MSDSSYSLYKIDKNTWFAYQKPGPFQYFPNSFKDVYDYSLLTFKEENLPTLAWVAASTAILLSFDQALVDESQRFGRRIGVESTNHVKTVGDIFGFPIQLPTDLPSGLYFIGDGWTQTGITATFFTFGLLTGDTRALQTSSQLAEGILAAAFVTQFLKHITGRQSPVKATKPGGRWDFFPNQVEYHKNVPAYDAYPSGHLAVGITVLEIIAENYKEYKFIKPLGYSLLTILCYQMLNNGVHWASDYPLAIAMGYSIAHLVLKRGRRVIHTNGQQPAIYDNLDLGFRIGSRNQPALVLSYNF